MCHRKFSTIQNFTFENSNRLYTRIIQLTFELSNSQSDLKTRMIRPSFLKLFGNFAGFNVLDNSIRLSTPLLDCATNISIMKVEYKVTGNFARLEELEEAFLIDNSKLNEICGESTPLKARNFKDVQIKYTGYTISNYARVSSSKLTNNVRMYSTSRTVLSKTSNMFAQVFSVMFNNIFVFVALLLTFIATLSVYFGSIINSFILSLIAVLSTQILTSVVVLTVPILLTVVFFTLAERHVMASMQRRVGPSVTGIGGLLQAFADGIKLGVKEPILPELSASGAFSAAPMISFVLSQISFCGLFISDAAFQGLVLMALSSLGVYGVMLSGWASNSKYAFLGCLRSVSLMVSYELGFGAALLSISLFLTDSTGMKSLNFGDAYPFISYALLPLFFIFLVCILAETKRVPFDLPEAEAELVAGYNVEYSSLGFALFFISEYANMAVMSALASIYFLGGFSAFKLTAIFFFFVWCRATLPRYRYDQFLRLGWKSLLPLSLSLYSMYAVFDFVV